jgi:Raf kinase inhibitor-like YbhB/YbcL family protein
VVDIARGTTSVGTGEVPEGGVQVVNSSGEASYVGPCPPSGEHRYRFTLYALDAQTGLTQSANLDDALDTVGDHATSSGTVTAVYARH